MRARNPGPTPLGLGVEVFDTGGWLTNGILHWMSVLISLLWLSICLSLLGFRCQCVWLKVWHISSVWAPASQESSHVGSAGRWNGQSEGCAFVAADVYYCAISWFS